MKRLIADQDRKSPLYFVGRNEEIDQIAAVRERVRAGRGQGCTQVITGAPGAGKTALLSELKRRWAKELPQVALVEAAAEQFRDPERIVGAVFEAMHPQAARAASAAHTETQHTGGGAGVPGVASVSMQRENARAYPAANLKYLEDIVRHWPDGDPMPLTLLFVDEAQNLTADAERPVSGDPLSSLLTALHAGNHGLPILPVFAGLGDTVDRLEALGVSRLGQASRFVLGRLSHSECVDAAAKTLARFRVQGPAGQYKKWIAAIADSSDGWPHHLQNNLRGACKALVAAGGDLASADLALAQAEGQKAREDYYAQRLGSLAEVRAAVAAALSAVDPEHGGEYMDISAAAHASVQEAAQRSPEIADRWNARNVITSMIHAGILDPGADRRLRCPIPSMRRYIETYGGQAAPAAAAPRP